MNAPDVPDAPLVAAGACCLLLCDDPARVRAQLRGERLDHAQAGPLRDDVSTDEISPLAAMVHFDAALGRFAHTGFSTQGERPIGAGALQAAGVQVLVGGRRYGKGSSREHSPLAEVSAGVKLVWAESFERIYRQNADNLGLATSDDPAVRAALERGEAVTLEQVQAGRDPQAAAIVRAGGLLQLPPPAAEHAPPIDGPQTLFDKVVQRHRVAGGWVRADLRFVHEYYTGMCDHLLRQAFGDGVTLHDRATLVTFEDHLSVAHRSPLYQDPQLLAGARRLSRAHRDFVFRHGLVDHGWLAPDDGGDGGSEGIAHALVAERYAQPGQLVVGTDSHTPHSGALGCVAFGVGSTEMAYAMRHGMVHLGRPQVLRVEVDAPLPVGVSAKDLALHLLARPDLRAGAGVGRVFEFGGPGIRALDTDERATLTNMTAEMGGFTGLVEPDAETVRFLRERRGLDFALQPWMRSDLGAPYAQVITVAAASLSPCVARPGDPGLGVPLADLGLPAQRPAVDIAYGGSCTAGKRADFEQYHAVLAWANSAGRRVAAGVQLILQFGTVDVRDWCDAQGWLDTFRAVGAELLPPACGACANCGPGASTSAGQVTISAINRNFPGRSGPGAVWLGSPATVAASAIAGRLVSFDELRAGAA